MAEATRRIAESASSQLHTIDSIVAAEGSEAGPITWRITFKTKRGYPLELLR